jgi:hypothetical protein
MAIRNLVFAYEMKPLITLQNCWIEKLMLSDGAFNMEIVDSHIACLELRPRCLNSLTVRNSSLASVRCREGAGRFVVGNARFTNLVTPRGISWYNKQPDEADQWAKAKQDLAALGNAWAAGIFHATEMSIRSREDSSGFVRQIGRFYEDACDYGNSIGRPIRWIVFWFFLSWLAYFTFDLESPSVIPEPASCVGWVKSLCGESGWAQFWRTFYLSAQPVINPLAGITGASVVVPGAAAHVYSIFHRILALVLIFLIVVAIRRRFRLTVEGV